MVPGPGGIAIACFPDGTQEIPGLTNDAVANHADGAKEAPRQERCEAPIKGGVVFNRWDALPTQLAIRVINWHRH